MSNNTFAQMIHVRNYNDSRYSDSDTNTEGHSNNSLSYSALPFDIMNDNPTDRLQLEQQRRYNVCDVVWSVLFLAQLLVMIAVSIIYIPQMYRVEIEEKRRETSDDDTYNVSYDRTDAYMYSIVTPYFGVCCILTVFLISFITKLMMKHSDRLIQLSLLFNLCVLTLYTFLAVQFGVSQEFLPIPIPVVIPCIVLLVLIFVIVFTFRVWVRIPVAAQIIIAAMAVVGDNIGTLSLYAYISFLLTCSYAVLLFKFWAAIVTVRFFNYCDNGPCTERFWLSGFEWSLVLISFYWTTKVFTNIIHVTTSDIVGKLCLSPTEIHTSGMNPPKHVMTTSFGSICMGSFIIGFVRIIYNFIDYIRYCSCGFLASCTDPLLKYLEPVDRWAYVSMGVHGKRFMEAGKHSKIVFLDSGYTTTIPDQVDTLLFMVDFSVGFLSALYFAAIAIPNWDSRDSTATLLAFAVIPFFLGTMLSMTFFSMIGVAVKTVTLCFLEFPDKFQENHPSYK